MPAGSFPSLRLQLTSATTITWVGFNALDCFLLSQVLLTILTWCCWLHKLFPQLLIYMPHCLPQIHVCTCQAMAVVPFVFHPQGLRRHMLTWVTSLDQQSGCEQFYLRLSSMLNCSTSQPECVFVYVMLSLPADLFSYINVDTSLQVMSMSICLLVSTSVTAVSDGICSCTLSFLALCYPVLILTYLGQAACWQLQSYNKQTCMLWQQQHMAVCQPARTYYRAAESLKACMLSCAMLLSSKAERLQTCMQQNASIYSIWQ